MVYMHALCLNHVTIVLWVYVEIRHFISFSYDKLIMYMYSLLLNDFKACNIVCSMIVGVPIHV